MYTFRHFSQVQNLLEEAVAMALHRTMNIPASTYSHGQSHINELDCVVWTKVSLQTVLHSSLSALNRVSSWANTPTIHKPRRPLHLYVAAAVCLSPTSRPHFPSGDKVIQPGDKVVIFLSVCLSWRGVSKVPLTRCLPSISVSALT